MVALETYRSVEIISENKPVQPWAVITGVITTQLCALWSDSAEFCEEIVRLVA
jgi:hypothetical protein